MSEKKNTTPQRMDKEFERILLETKGKYLMKGRKVTIPRITLAMARQYKKYPNLLKELEEGIK